MTPVIRNELNEKGLRGAHCIILQSLTTPFPVVTSSFDNDPRIKPTHFTTVERFRFFQLARTSSTRKMGRLDGDTMRLFLLILVAAFVVACSSDTEKPAPTGNNQNNQNNENNEVDLGADQGMADLSPPDTCDGQAVDPAEACDGEELGGETCVTLGFSGGTLACRADCLGFVTESCERDQSGPGVGDPCPVGQHLCDAMCILDDEGPGCGPNCELCTEDPNGTTYCASGSCGLQCDSGYRRCDGTCAQCPGQESVACDGAACVAATCQAGEYPFDGGCPQWLVESAIGEDGVNHPDGPSLAVDSAGVVHVAYYNGWSGGLRYATYDGAWTDTGIGVQDGGTASPSIALDSAGRPHIVTARIDQSSITEGFAHYWHDGTQWQSEVLIAGKRTFGEIYIDSNDVIHVAFRRMLGAEEEPNGAIPRRKISQIYYGRKAPGDDWELTSIDQEDDVGRSWSKPAMVMDADTFYITYTDGFVARLAEGTPAGFTRSVLARGDIGGLNLEVRPDGGLSAVYTRVWDEDDNTVNAPPNQLFYAIREGGAWSETALRGVPGEYMGFGLGFDYDADGQAVITHYVGSNTLGGDGELHLIRQTTSGWEFQVVDTTDQPGLSSDLVFDADGRPHIVAEDNSADRLKYYTLP